MSLASALDGQTKKLAAANLREGLPLATLIVITHRPALAEIADSIVVIENGAARVSRPARTAALA